MKSIIFALAAFAAAGSAYADDANTNPCKAPVTPTAQSSEIIIKLFNKRLTAYKKCIDTFVEERRAVVKESTDQAKAAAAYEAAEAAQKEYNALIDEVNAKSAPPPEEK
ncbi:MAG TPA: hypothetical protein VIF60_16885 [Burkholderiaceae bacterium]|jgi:CHAT domain-containing protein